MLPGSPNQPNRSAIKWLPLQPGQVTITTPVSYVFLLNIFADLVSAGFQTILHGDRARQ